MPKQFFIIEDVSGKKKESCYLSSIAQSDYEDVFLCYNLSFFLSVILLSKLWSLDQVHEVTGKWAGQNGTGERAYILRLLGLSYTL